MRCFVLALASAAAACGGHPPNARTPPAADHATNADASSPVVREDDSHIPAWYEVQPLLADVRHEAIETAEAVAGPLGELPLYDFDLTIEPAAGTFRVDERVFFQNTSSAPLSDVVLRLYANTPRVGATPEKLEGGHCVLASCTVDMLGRDGIVVHPAQPLARGARLRVVLHVTGRLRNIEPSRTTMMAAAMSSLKTIMPGSTEVDDGDYGLLGSGDDILSFANFYPVLARHSGDAWDMEQSTRGDIGPDALAHVRAHVDLPAGYVVAASGAVVRDDVTDGRRHIDVVAGCMRDFALLASHEFVTAERDVDGVAVRSFFRGSDRATGEKVLDVGAWALRDFQKRFGPYPYRALDLVEQALVAGAGGVEFSGLVTVASMFYKPSGTDAGVGGLEAMLGVLMGSGVNDGPMKASAAEFTTAHEVAHQWWHVTVGSDSRMHPWQDEALAQFSAMLYDEDRYGVARAKREGDTNARMAYEVMRLLGQPDGPVDVPASKQSQVAYGGLVYGKGPYYLVALRKLLGDATFFVALQAYVRQFYLGFAPPRALADAMSSAAEKAKRPEVVALSHRWLDESYGDDDLGHASLGGLMTMASGGQSPAALGAAGGPDVQQLIKMLQGSGAGTDGMDVQQMLEQMLRQ